MDIRLYFNGGKHMITHEYYTYGTYSFIPDIGGYLVVISGEELNQFSYLCIINYRDCVWVPAFLHSMI